MKDTTLDWSGHEKGGIPCVTGDMSLSGSSHKIESPLFSLRLTELLCPNTRACLYAPPVFSLAPVQGWNFLIMVFPWPCFRKKDCLAFSQDPAIHPPPRIPESLCPEPPVHHGYLSDFVDLASTDFLTSHAHHHSDPTAGSVTASWSRSNIFSLIIANSFGFYTVTNDTYSLLFLIKILYFSVTKMRKNVVFVLFNPPGPVTKSSYISLSFNLWVLKS